MIDALLDFIPPLLITAARYAETIQSRIAALPSKDGGRFAAALSDADPSIQTYFEVALLSAFPQVGFLGEEASCNAKYFPMTGFTGAAELLVTLDPIDGTRYYLDQRPYQIVCSLITPEHYEGVVVAFPKEEIVVIARRGGGVVTKDFAGNVVASRAIGASKNVWINSGVPFDDSGMAGYRVMQLDRDYDTAVDLPTYAGILYGAFDGAAIRRSQLIDGAAVAFAAKEAGYIVTNLSGAPISPPRDHDDKFCIDGVVIASSQELHALMLAGLKA